MSELHHLELFKNGGAGTLIKCKFGHAGATLVTLRTVARKQAIHIWYNCPTCARDNPSQGSWQMPQSVEDAINLLKKSGRMNRPNIYRLIYQQ